MCSRLAVFSDVHGNARALRAVLADIERDSDITQLVSLGDMIGIGPETDAVLDLLVARDGLLAIEGNHEAAVLDIVAGKELEGTPHELEHERWIARGLDRRFEPWLRALPRSIEACFGGVRFLFQHYRVEAGGEWSRGLPRPEPRILDAWYKESKARVVCFGHDHSPSLVVTPDRAYLDPGSLGGATRPVARYAVVDVSEYPVRVEFREVPYDRAGSLASYKELQVPAADFVLEKFHGVSVQSVAGADPDIWLRTATEHDAADIARIYNQGIRSRGATFEAEERTTEERAAWLTAHGAHHPVLVAVRTGRRDEGCGEVVVGWASIGPYSNRACYHGVGEVSVYVDADHRGRGVARSLVAQLIARARGLGYWKLMARLFPTNEVSRRLFESAGFGEVGVLRKHGQLDGIWLDNILIELVL